MLQFVTFVDLLNETIQINRLAFVELWGFISSQVLPHGLISAVVSVVTAFLTPGTVSSGNFHVT